uniref:Hemicentin 1 n=1 Tax=Aquila chrysaetos chrysaetos TaxID=223781 RepID=A0A663EF14_AQUCH
MILYINFFTFYGLNLSSLVPPKIQRGPRVLKVQAGHRVDIPCSAQGIPPPTITWFKGRSAVPIGGGQFIHSLDGALGISNVQLPDAGIYKCVASNVAGSDASEITVQTPLCTFVPEHYQWTKNFFGFPTLLQVVAGSSLTLECKAAGNPLPLLTWLKDGVPVKASDNLRILPLGREHLSLNLSCVVQILNLFL